MRIIPARAGFTSRRATSCPPRTDHPRSRGVYRERPPSRAHPRGSSPLARGLHPYRTCAARHRRIIPARAGFTSRPRGALALLRDHPRSRGVYTFNRSLTGEDHPRSRGVYEIEEDGYRALTGSSPLARGLLRPEPRRHPVRRIIPARAGFTVGWGSRPVPSLDHPRSRGVYSSSVRRIRFPPGSSPLARGLRAHAADETPVGGIIPARAGFTTGHAMSAQRVPDHPRSRGVYPRAAALRHESAGSSPLARGLRSQIPSGRLRGRIIPARAGFTPAWPWPGPPACGSSPLARGLRV